MALVFVKIPSVLDATCPNHRVGVKKGTVKDAKNLGAKTTAGAKKRGTGNASIFGAMMMMMMMMTMKCAGVMFEWWHHDDVMAMT